MHAFISNKRFKRMLRASLVCALVVSGVIAIVFVWRGQKSDEQRAAEAEAQSFKELAEKQRLLAATYEKMAAEAEDESSRKELRERARKAAEEAKKYECLCEEKLAEAQEIAAALKREKIQKKIARLESLLAEEERRQAVIKEQILSGSGDQMKLSAEYDEHDERIERLENDLLKLRGLIEDESPKKVARSGPPGRYRGALVESGSAVPVKVSRVGRDAINAYLLTTTTLAPEKRVDIVAKISGEVTDLSVEVGDKVKAGQILAKIDEEEARLNLESAKVKYDNAEREYQRAKRTYERGITSDQELQDKKLAFDTAKVQYDQAKLNFEYSRVKSTIDGIVVSRDIEYGDFVRANSVIFGVADFDPILARIHIPEKDVLKVKLGDTARIVAESAPDKEFEGRVRLLDPTVDPESGTVKVEIEIRDGSPSATSKKSTGDADDFWLRPGTFASVYIITERHEDALVIPKDALLLESEFDEIYVVRDLVKMSVPAQKAALIEAGDPLTLTLENSNEAERSEPVESKLPTYGNASNTPADAPPVKTVWRGEVYKVAANSAGDVRPGVKPSRVEVIIRLADDNHGLRAGMLASAFIDVGVGNEPGGKAMARSGPRDRSASPRMGASNGRNSIASGLRIEAQPIGIETRAFKTRLKLGFSEGANVEVLEGLKIGERVVTVGQDDLQQGSLVNIIEDRGVKSESAGAEGKPE